MRAINPHQPFPGLNQAGIALCGRSSIRGGSRSPIFPPHRFARMTKRHISVRDAIPCEMFLSVGALHANRNGAAVTLLGLGRAPVRFQRRPRYFLMVPTLPPYPAQRQSISNIRPELATVFNSLEAVRRGIGIINPLGHCNSRIRKEWGSESHPGGCPALEVSVTLVHSWQIICVILVTKNLRQTYRDKRAPGNL